MIRVSEAAKCRTGFLAIGISCNCPHRNACHYAVIPCPACSAPIAARLILSLQQNATSVEENWFSMSTGMRNENNRRHLSAAAETLVMHLYPDLQMA